MPEPTSEAQTANELEAMRTLLELQSHELARLRRDLDEAHRVLTRLAANQLGLGG